LPCSTASCKSCREAHHTYRFTIRCLLLVYGHTSCSQPSNAARCVFTDPEAVRLPALPSHLDPLSLLCSAACCYSDSWVAAAVCACSAITRARARRACRCGPHKCQPRFDQARQCPRPHLAGCGHTSQSPQAQAAELGVVFLDLGWCERCLVGGAFVIVHACLLPRPAACRGMQSVWPMATQAGMC